ncbi:hypothetical protein A3D88_00375 [Candidatus Peribacteria bacterium RIFCSPHIGHO2_02_FULL_52_16]|nr:MAG: hypothetical protein A2706_05910 [Candidatus Peribacteria bacterium RIFCSPHIGHO2_01_FULL_51_35]OGJ61931.1 MAG: hypothetical protein A3D88_00375 [Candidatus Peribacteria bacterium RIFCSPHIGHO2_02_FULL_52_16]
MTATLFLATSGFLPEADLRDEQKRKEGWEEIAQMIVEQGIDRSRITQIGEMHLLLRLSGELEELQSLQAYLRSRGIHAGIDTGRRPFHAASEEEQPTWF